MSTRPRQPRRLGDEPTSPTLWFGEWFGPICVLANQVATPVGQVCPSCLETIEEGDKGVILPYYGGDDVIGTTAMHIECMTYQVLGSPAHVLRLCHHFLPGSLDDDPPFLTRRESARLTVWLRTLLDEAEVKRKREVSKN